MEHIDEMTNEELARKGHSEIILRGELDRVESLVSRNVMTGADLSHWHDRSRVIRSLLNENSRSALL